MKITEIKDKRQDNGLWGIPRNITRYNVSFGDKTFYEEQVISAMVISIANLHYNSDISVRDYHSENTIEFNIDTGYDGYGDKHAIHLNYKKFGLFKNKLVEFTTKEDELNFNRFLKIKRIVN
jgi:hypothetical protein